MLSFLQSFHKDCLDDFNNAREKGERNQKAGEGESLDQKKKPKTPRQLSMQDYYSSGNETGSSAFKKIRTQADLDERILVYVKICLSQSHFNVVHLFFSGLLLRICNPFMWCRREASEL